MTQRILALSFLVGWLLSFAGWPLGVGFAILLDEYVRDCIPPRYVTQLLERHTDGEIKPSFLFVSVSAFFGLLLSTSGQCLALLSRGYVVLWWLPVTMLGFVAGLGAAGVIAPVSSGQAVASGAAAGLIIGL